MKLSYLFSTLIAAVFSFQGYSQGISLVKDLDPGVNSTSIASFTKAGGYLYFVGNGNDLWRTDGTDAGTTLLLHANSIVSLTEFGTELYFIADDNVHGQELWHTNGTLAGTAMLMDINPGANAAFSAPSSNIIPIKVMNSKLYFCADDGTHNKELWVSDGTAMGTHMVIDLNTTPVFGGKGVFDVLETLGNTIFFDGNDGTGYGIWMTDGTATGTTFFKTMLGAQNFYRVNNKLYYTDLDASSNNDLWVTDGTIGGTTKLITVTSSSVLARLVFDYTVLNNKLFFFSPDAKKIFVTDGTPQGSMMIKDSLLGYPFSTNPQQKLMLTAFNNKIYFSGTTVGNNNSELWESDGTAAGTNRFFDIAGPNYASMPSNLIAMGSKLYFRARDSVRAELWVSNGTAAGTYKITDPNADYIAGLGAIAANINLAGDIAIYNNMLIYTNKYLNAIGKELYKIDLPTGIEERVAATDNVSIYPNPTTGTFTIDFKDNSYTTLTVLNQLGQAVYTQSLSAQQGKQEVQLDGLSNGVYYIKLSGNDKIATSKIIIAQ